MAKLVEAIFEDKDQKTKEMLEILLAAARAKLTGYEYELKSMFMNPDADQVEIVGNRAMEWVQQYRVKAKAGVDDAIMGIIDNFFQGTEEGLKTGFQSMIKIGLDTILGNAEAGEHESKFFLIVPEYNTFVRVDVKMWKYNFQSTGILGVYEDAMCFVFCKSVVDHSTLSLDELIYLVSKMFGTQLNLPETKKYLDQMKTLWDTLSGQDPQKTLAAYRESIGKAKRQAA